MAIRRRIDIISGIKHRVTVGVLITDERKVCAIDGYGIHLSACAALATLSTSPAYAAAVIVAFAACFAISPALTV